MPRPGVTVDVVDSVEGGSPILDTGQGFFVGTTERGPEIGRASSGAEFKKNWGIRTGGAAMYDDVLAFFDEGGSSAIISRVASATAVKGTIAFGTGLFADAVSAGTWGNNVKVNAIQPVGGTGTAGDPIHIAVLYNNVEVERSRVISSTAEAITWAMEESNYIRFRAAGGAAVLPIQGTTVTLTAGTNGAALATADWTTALARMKYEMGPGQVSLPGITDINIMTVLGQHLEDNDRTAVVDLADSGNESSLISARAALNAVVGSRLMMAMGHWVLYPAETPPATQLIPYSGIQLGMIARTDRIGDLAAVAAGKNAIMSRAVGLSYDFSDAQRQNLNANGVNLGRQMYGLIRTYGNRAASGPDKRDNWTFFKESRVVCAIAHECNAAMEDYVFETIDGLRHLFVQVENALVGICAAYWQAGALFGATPSDGFRVDMSVNTIDTIKLGEVHAAVYVKTSKVAEWIKIDIVKVPVERSLVAAA